MNAYDACEVAHKNGFDKGFQSGKYEEMRQLLMFFEVQMSDNMNCTCGRHTMKQFYKYCPYCGKKI